MSEKDTSIPFEGPICWIADDEQGFSHDCEIEVAIQFTCDISGPEDDLDFTNVQFTSVQERTKRGLKAIDDADLISTIKEVFIEEHLHETMIAYLDEAGNVAKAAV